MASQSLFESDYFQRNSVYKKFSSPVEAVASLSNYYFGLFHLLKNRSKEKFKSSSRVLGVGCGYSGLLPYFLGEGLEYTGLDISEYIIKEMGEVYPSVKFTRHDIQEPLLGLGQFDLIVALEVLEHVPNIASGLINIANLLAPGGLFLATVPNPRSRIPLTDWRRDSTHVTILPKEDWASHFKKSGFTKVEATTIFSIPFFWRFHRRFSNFFVLPEYGASILLSAAH